MSTIWNCLCMLRRTDVFLSFSPTSKIYNTETGTDTTNLDGSVQKLRIPTSNILNVKKLEPCTKEVRASTVRKTLYENSEKSQSK